MTIGQYRAYVNAIGYATHAEKAIAANEQVHTRATWQSPDYAVTAASPVTCITWGEAVAFANWLSEQEVLTPYYRQDDAGAWEAVPDADGYRLPTEAEWEYACPAPARPPSTRIATTKPSSGSSPGSKRIRATKPRRPGVASRPMPLDCTTCTATSGNGAKTGTAKPGMRSRPASTRPAPFPVHSACVRGGAWNGEEFSQRSPTASPWPLGNNEYHNIFGFRLARTATARRKVVRNCGRS